MRAMAQEITNFPISEEIIKPKERIFEPISVLDTRSPSPSTSTSTFGGGGAAATAAATGFSDTTTTHRQKWPDSVPHEMGFSGSPLNLSAAATGFRKDDWPEIQPLPENLHRFGVGLDDWENLLSESCSFPADQSLLRWISGEGDDTAFTVKQLLNVNQIDQNTPPSVCNPFLPPPLLPETQYRHPGFHEAPVFDEFVLKKQMAAVEVTVKREKPPPSPRHRHHENQLVCDQLRAAAELVVSGNFSHAQAILARLNHRLSSPFHRVSFCFKEALEMQMNLRVSGLNSNVPTPSNGVLKMGAYKVLSEVSPIVQFVNFTSNQALFEALDGADYVHIVDFDIGFGAQWASFIQELPSRRNNREFCSLKITAFASPSTHHPFELGLMHENLSQFARELGVSFELEVVNVDSFDPNTFSISENETIAVNLPIWSASLHLPSLLNFIKRLSPRVVVSLDRGCERTDLPFADYLLGGLHYFETLLNSIDAANIPLYAANKIEKFIVQPQIESMVSGRLRFPEPTPHWKTIFSAHGYSPVVLSNFAEAQADCVVKRAQVRGFHVERRQAELVLFWQNRELVGAAAWKC